MIRVSEATRRRVREISEQTHQTADQVLNQALDELVWRRKREQLRRDSAEAYADPVDRAEMAAVYADMEEMGGAW